MRVNSKNKFIAVLALSIVLMLSVFAGMISLTAKADGSSFAIDTEASIRTDNPAGIRFETWVLKEEYQELKAKNAVFGTVVIPETMLGANDLTVALDGDKIVSGITDGLVVIANSVRVNMLDNPLTDGIDESLYSYYNATLVGESDGQGGYAGFPKELYGATLVARSFVVYDGDSEKVIEYADNVTRRSIAYVAKEIIAEGSDLFLPEEYEFFHEITDEVAKNNVLATAKVNLLADDVTLSAQIAEEVKGVYLNDVLVETTYDAGILTFDSAYVEGLSVGEYSYKVITANSIYTLPVVVESIEIVNVATATYTSATESVVIDLSEYAEGAFVSANDAGVTVSDKKVTIPANFGKVGEYTVAVNFEENIVNVPVIFYTGVIASADDWNAMENNNYYVLNGNVDFTGKSITTGKFSASVDGGFNSTLDGRGYTINGLTAATRMFTFVNGATFKNLAFTNMNKTAGWHSIFFHSSNYNVTTFENVYMHQIIKTRGYADEGYGNTNMISQYSQMTSFKDCVFVADFDFAPSGSVVSASGIESGGANAGSASNCYYVNLGSTAVNLPFINDGSMDNTYASASEFANDSEEIAQKFNDMWTTVNGMLIFKSSLPVMTNTQTEIYAGSSVALTSAGIGNATYSLAQAVDGVSISGSTLSVSATALAGSVTVVATFDNVAYNGQVSAQKTFTIKPATAVTTAVQFLETTTANEVIVDLSQYNLTGISNYTIDGVSATPSFADGKLTIAKSSVSNGLKNVNVLATSANGAYNINIPLEVADYVLGADASEWTRFGKAIGGREDSAQFSGKRAILTADIDYQGKDWGAEIGTNCGRFLIGGELDGRGYSVSNIKSYDAVNMWGQSYGLFSHISGGAVLKNISFLNIDVKSQNGLLARNAGGTGSTIENVLITGDYEMTANSTGDFVGVAVYYADASAGSNFVVMVDFVNNSGKSNITAVAGYGLHGMNNVYAVSANTNGLLSGNVNSQITGGTYESIDALNADANNLVSTLNSATTSVEWYVDNGTIAMKPIA